MDYTNLLPRELIEHGATLFKHNLSDKFKWVIENKAKNYRHFVYEVPNPYTKASKIDCLIASYKADLNVYSEHQDKSLGMLGSRE